MVSLFALVHIKGWERCTDYYGVVVMVSAPFKQLVTLMITNKICCIHYGVV